MAKISVIIPVYNTEKYLRRCLDSVCNQTLSDIEIICINDCSTDNSLEILREYSAKDERVKVIDFKENKGAAVARNTGIDEAKGEYIGFVDSDDYPESNNFYEQLYNKVFFTNADIAKGAYKNSHTGYIDTTINQKIKEDKNNFCSTYCSAIFRSSLVKENNIRFPNIRDMEDPVFAFNCALLANKVEIVDNLNMIITHRQDSITSSIPSLKQIQDKFFGLELIFKLDKALSNNYVLGYWLCTVILDSLKNTTTDAYNLVYNNCQNYIETLTKNDNLRYECSKYNCKFLSNLVLKRIIDKHDIISFDIFDTLLLRPFKEPTDLFYFIQELQAEYNNFYNDRITAEKAARFFNQKRNNNFEDITYDDIYKNIEKKYPGFKELELEIEFKTLQKNNEIAEIYNYTLEKGKKIIITSDMYLPKEFLTKVLNAKGYNNFSKLYVSSETKVCKGTGKMFDYIINDLNVLPNKILHIGDNLISDVKMPNKKGLSTHYYQQVKNNYPATETGFNILIKHNYEIKNNYWYKLAFYQGGPLLLAFIQAINKIAKKRNLTDLFFIARDGYIVKKAYEKLYPNSAAKSHYIYATRKLSKLYENNPLINNDNEYLKYAKSICLKGDDIGIIDTCAGAFSAQKLVEKYWPNKTFIGIYLATFLNYKFNYINLSSQEHTSDKLGFKWDLIETFFSSPEPPIENLINCNPVYRENLGSVDIFNMEISKYFENGLLDYINKYQEIFGCYNQEHTKISDTFDSLKNFWENLSTEDIEMLDKIKHPVDTAQKKYLSLVSNKN